MPRLRFLHFFSVSAVVLTFCSSIHAQLVINEVDADQTGTDSAEFVELYDGGTGNTALDGHVLVLYNGSNNASYRTIDLSGHATNAQGYFVVGNPGVPNVALEIEPGGSGAFQNGPDAVALYQASVDDFPDGTPISATGLLDAVVYGTDDDDDFDLLDGLTPGEIQVNDTRTESMSRLPDGGEPFASSLYGLQAPTPGFANVISEELTLALSAPSVSESAGAGALEITVSRSGATEFPATVSLGIIDFTEATVPGELTIPAGASAATFFLDAVDDAWADGTQVVTLLATSPGLKETSADVEITDDAEDRLGLIVNEFYADDQDDANEDGEGALDGPGFDEFVEFVNVGETAVDLSGHSFHDGVASRHQFPAGTVIEPGCALVLFGGGDVIEGNSSMFGGAIVQLANDANEFGLGLNNAGDFIRLLNADGVEVAGLLYEATDGDNGSRVREPELTGDFVYHLDVADSPALFIYTPGFSAKAEPFCTLTLALSAEVSPIRISEDAGVGASTLTLTRTGPTNAALTVTLATDDPSEISLPSTVEIPDGEAFVVVPIDAVNDEAQDGDIVVRITASAPEFLTGTVEIQVLDDGDAPTMLVINEIDADQPGTDMGEFIELYDGGVGNLPLDGFVLVLFNGSNNESYATYDLAGSSTNAEGYFVIGQADVRHVNLAVNGFTLQNGPDGVALYRGVGSQFPNGSFPIDDDLVDALVYGTDDPDADGLLTDLLPDQAQVNEGTANNNESIGRENDGGDPLNTSAFVSMVPSPGAANGSVQGAAYALWESQFPDLGGQEDDPDGDGLSNALEYAFGLNPLASEPGQHLSVTREDGTFVVSIPAPEPIPEDVSLAIEASTTLDQWEPQPGLSGSIQNGLFRIRASDALTDAPTAFIRIVATIAP